MDVIIKDSAQEAAQVVADIIQRTLEANQSPVLGLATGSSPLPTYRELIRRCRAGELTFRHAQAFLLDEYVGLPPGHPEAYISFIRREFTDQVDLGPEAVLAPPADERTLTTDPKAYDHQIQQAGGIDVQLLGIGSDGHIGFNEPCSSLASRTRLKTLTDATRADNARFFEDDPEAVPRHVVTQGIGTILDARRLVLVASGKSKAMPVAAAVEGPVSAMVPASALQLHPRATVVLDRPAASTLQLREYYLEVQRHRPDWQMP